MRKKLFFLAIILVMTGNICTIRANNIKVSNFLGKYTYFSQFSTTNSGIFDCGPAVLKMVLSGFIDVEGLNYTDIRRNIGAGESIMYMSEIKKGLTYYDVPYKLEKYIDDQTLIEILDDGKIAILCINMEKIKYIKGQNGQVYGKNVETLTSGHFVVLTGYEVEDDKLYFEVLDPYNRKIANQYIFEEVSYYESESLKQAIKSWSNEIIVIEETH